MADIRLENVSKRWGSFVGVADFADVGVTVLNPWG